MYWSLLRGDCIKSKGGCLLEGRGCYEQIFVAYYRAVSVTYQFSWCFLDFTRCEFARIPAVKGLKVGLMRCREPTKEKRKQLFDVCDFASIAKRLKKNSKLEEIVKCRRAVSHPSSEMV